MNCLNQTQLTSFISITAASFLKEYTIKLKFGNFIFYTFLLLLLFAHNYKKFILSFTFFILSKNLTYYNFTIFAFIIYFLLK